MKVTGKEKSASRADSSEQVRGPKSGRFLRAGTVGCGALGVVAGGFPALQATATAPRGQTFQAALDERGGVAVDEFHDFQFLMTAGGLVTKGILPVLSCAYVKKP